MAAHGDEGVTTPVIPQTYAQWHHCITVECGIALTRAFIDERLAALRGGRDDGRRFAQLYGESHLQRVPAWFEEARRALAEKRIHE